MDWCIIMLLRTGLYGWEMECDLDVLAGEQHKPHQNSNIWASQDSVAHHLYVLCGYFGLYPIVRWTRIKDLFNTIFTAFQLPVFFVHGLVWEWAWSITFATPTRSLGPLTPCPAPICMLQSGASQENTSNGTYSDTSEDAEDMKTLPSASEKWRIWSQNGVCSNPTLVMTGTYVNLEVCGSNYNKDHWLDESAGSGGVLTPSSRETASLNHKFIRGDERCCTDAAFWTRPTVSKWDRCRAQGVDRSTPATLVWGLR